MCRKHLQNNSNVKTLNILVNAHANTTTSIVMVKVLLQCTYMKSRCNRLRGVAKWTRSGSLLQSV